MTIRDKGAGQPVSVSPDNYWLYPHEHKAPRGVKIYLLTKGGVSVEGNWSDDGRFIAWQHLFKRDRTKEQQS